MELECYDNLEIKMILMIIFVNIRLIYSCFHQKLNKSKYIFKEIQI